jgi:hypothetical protein
MLLLALAAVVGSQWYYSRIQQRPLALWGKAPATAIVKSPVAVALLLGKARQPSKAGTIETIHMGKTQIGVIDRRMVANAPGFSHLRASLVNEASFDWEAPTDNCEPNWEYGLEFSVGDGNNTLLLFAPNCRQVQLPQSGATATLRTMDGIVKFMHEQFGEPNADPKEERKD